MIKKQLPNLLTLANLLCGTLIIINAFQLQFENVAWLAAAALAFDFLDGTAARLLKVSSPMGKELDSMADMISFGAAPALVLYTYWGNELFAGTDQSITGITIVDSLLPFFPLLIAAFAGYRLAKFNISEQSNDYFSGLPTPALAIAAFSIPLAAEQSLTINTWLTHPVFIVLFSILGGILLVSNIELFSLKIGSKNKKLNILRIVLVAICIALISGLHFFGAFLCLVVYLSLSLAAQKII
jgi:CDP-diacylglycerol--serine O-phosphatidyltransferase